MLGTPGRARGHVQAPGKRGGLLAGRDVQSPDPLRLANRVGIGDEPAMAQAPAPQDSPDRRPLSLSTLINRFRVRGAPASDRPPVPHRLLSLCRSVALEAVRTDDSPDDQRIHRIPSLRGQHGHLIGVFASSRCRRRTRCPIGSTPARWRVQAFRLLAGASPRLAFPVRTSRVRFGWVEPAGRTLLQ